MASQHDADEVIATPTIPEQLISDAEIQSWRDRGDSHFCLVIVAPIDVAETITCGHSREARFILDATNLRDDEPNLLDIMANGIGKAIRRAFAAILEDQADG